MQFLKGGLFDKPFMQTKVTTQTMSTKEKLWGYILGPSFIMVYTTMVTSLREMFYMQVIQVDAFFGSGSYMALQSVASILGIIGGILMSYVTERTVSKAGRFRPYGLIGTILMALSGIGMFWTPFAKDSTATLVWLWIANIFYYGIATTLFGCSMTVKSVSTRNIKDRNFITTVGASVGNMMPGIFGALIVNGWLYFVFLVNDLDGFFWRLFIAIPAVVAIIFGFVQYFWTKERITEDNVAAVEEDNAPRVPLLQQIKNLLTNKYYVLSFLLGIGTSLGFSLQGVNARTYLTQYIFGANEYNGLAMIYLMISMQPIAFGTIVIPMLARKHGSRSILIGASIISLVGLVVAVIQPYNFALACLGGIIFSCGAVATTNMGGVVTQQAADMVEYKHGYRMEGTLGLALIGAIVGIVTSPMSAMFETVLHNLGFDPTLAVQNSAVNNWIIFSYYGGYAIIAIFMIVIMIFFNAEKKMPEVHAAIAARHRAAAEAKGLVYISPEEQEAMEREKALAEAEEERIADLKALCQRKGLDFDTENRKYLEKETKKNAKRKAKMEKRHKTAVK